ncbi:MAG: SDR family NAD(P)-dependent oxidoreductase [Nevskiales bacterium]
MIAAQNTWVVLGASSSIARAFARAAAESGSAVILAGRDQADMQASAADIRLRSGRSVEVLAFDASATGGHAGFVHRCRALCNGRLNVFLAFGHMPAQAALDNDPQSLRTTIEANFLGAASILTQFAPVLEAQRAGHVVVIGSVAGDRGRLKNYVYGAAKAGLHAYAQGLRARLCRSGITVLTVKPGFIDTAMSYGQPGLFLVAQPEALARAILGAVERGRLIMYYPWFWRWIMLVIRHIPERIFQRLNI